MHTDGSIKKDFNLNDSSDKDTAASTKKLATKEKYQNIKLEQQIEKSESGETILLNMNLTDEDVPVIIEKAINCECHRIELCGNHIKSNGIKILADALKTNTVLQELLLANNPNIGDKGAEYLVDLLINYNRTLKVLDLTDINLTNCGLALLSDAIKVNIQLRELRLGKNKFTHDGIKILADALKTNSTIINLDLSENNLTSECIITFADVLKYNTTLKSLDLSCNENINDDAIEHLVHVLLNQNRALNSLQLNNTGITDRGFKFILDAIRTNSTIECLYVNCNSLITDACIDFLIPIFHEVYTLKLLCMHCCYLSPYGRSLLVNAVKYSRVRLELNP